MKRIFIVPQTKYEDFYQEARFSLTWRINFILAFALLVLSIVFFYVKPTFLLHYATGFVLSTAGLIYLVLRKEYEIIAKFLGLFGLGLVSSSVFFVGGALHLIEPFWMAIITLFAYFTLGKNWGLYFLLYSLLTMVIYFLFLLNDNIASFVPLSIGQSIAMSIEFSLCMVIIGHIIHQFILTNKYAEEQMKRANIELKHQNELIDLQYKEKTVLLKEIHHRVKNNLQVIVSLLRMQSSEIKSEEAKQNFSDAINRIMTMSLIHQKMYQAQNLSQIDINDYFKTLTKDLISSGAMEFAINVEITTQIESIGSKTMVPLALIVTELVTNSIKHAFRDNGKIWLEIKATGDNKITLLYADNGNWKEKDGGSSFGLDLIQILSEQLEGSFKRDVSEEGTRYELILVNLQ